MDKKLELRLLGPFEVMAGGQPVEMPPSRKTRALLAYLALSARPVRRERLCELFWDLPDDPKGALRWSLSKIRRVTNGGGVERLAADRATVALDRAAAAVDWLALRQADADGLENLPTERLEALARALRGPFLEDLSLPRCPDFEAWRTAEAAQVEAVTMRLLRLLVERLQAEPERALAPALALRALLPDFEEGDALIAGLKQRIGRQDAPAPAPAPAPAAPAHPSPCKINYCITPDGVRLAWSENGAGPPLVRCPHWMTHVEFDTDSPIWRSWITGLGRSHRLIRFDQRCNGLTDRGVADISFERMVDDIGTVVDAAGLGTFVLLGISQSCAYAVAYAVRHPERVRGLILYGGFVKGWRARANPEEIARREAMNVLLQHGWGTEAPVFRQLFTAMFRPGATAEQAAWYNELQRRAATPEDALRLANMVGDIDVSGLLGQVRCPTLVMHGRDDLVAPIAFGRMFADGIPGARFVELDSQNHILTEDEPAFQRFVEECRRFTESVPERPATAAPPAPAPVAPARHEPGPQAAPDAADAPAAPAATPAAARSAAGPARRQITVLEAEIISPLQAFDEVDPELVVGTLAPLVAAAQQTVLASGGEILGTGDSSVTAAFGAREATEVHAVMAARAALALRTVVEKASGGRTRVRIGLDTGEAIVSAADASGAGVSGSVVRQARRLCHALRRGTAALSERTRQSAGGYLRLRPMERGECSGVSQDQPVHELLALNTAMSRWHLRTQRTLSRFVGRQAELDLLTLGWRRACEGRGEAVLIPADPGVGKSRLTHEFVAARAAEDAVVVECGSLELTRDVAYGVIKTLLRGLFAIDEADEQGRQERRLAQGLERIGARPALHAPLAFVLDLPEGDEDWHRTPGIGRARQIADAVRMVVALTAQQRPLLVLIEDLHWIDRESHAVLERLLEGLDRQKLLLLLTCRPEFRPGWTGRSAVHVLRLPPLGIEETEMLVRALIGEHPSVATLRRLLVERTDGTPLLIEETVRALEQAGRISGTTGAFVAPQPIVDIETASSATPVIAARIDRLAPTERWILQVAAVIGRTAPRPLLHALAGIGDAELSEGLAALERADFLFELLTLSEPEHAFKHALIHDAAYASLLAEDRRRLHAAALQAIERLHGGNLTEHLERLAEHAYRAEHWDPAAQYLSQAAERAIDRSAYPAAAVYLNRAVEALDALPETPDRLRLAIDVRLPLRLTSIVTGDYPGGVVRLKEARDLARQVGDAERQAHALLHLSFLHSTFGRLEKAIRAADDARAIGVEHGLERYVAEGDLAASQALLLRTDARAAFARLDPWFERFTTEWRNDRFGLLVTRAVWYLASLGYAAALTGDFERAERLTAEADELAGETRRPVDRYAATYHRNVVANIRGPGPADVERMRQVAEECLDRAPFPFSPWLLSCWGHGELRTGRPKQAISVFERALAAADAVHMVHFARLSRAMLACARAMDGDAGAADELELAALRAEKDRDGELMIRVLEAHAAIEPDAARAAAHLERAMRIAERTGLRPYEARLAAALSERAAAADRAPAPSPSPAPSRPQTRLAAEA